MNWLALDIGGANLKAADGKGFSVSQVFPMWQRSRQLTEALRTIVAGAPRSDHLAATMTGELADCFATKVEGVRFIIDSLGTAADGRHTRIYLNNGLLVSPVVALKQPLLAAAANWHALARFAGRYMRQGPGLLVDIGSTTCDIIPLVDGQPVAKAHTDPERHVKRRTCLYRRGAKSRLRARSRGALAEATVSRGPGVFRQHLGRVLDARRFARRAKGDPYGR